MKHAATQLRRAHRAFAALQHKLHDASLALNADPALRLSVDEMRATVRQIREPLVSAIQKAEAADAATTESPPAASPEGA